MGVSTLSEALQEKDLFDAAEEATPKKPRLYLLDGMALFYRAHFAMVRSHRYTSGGVCTSGIFGMTGAVFDLIKRENPTHMAVAFDTEHPTERHRIFPEYKAQRDAMPEDMAAQKPLLDRLFQAMKIPILRNPGYEADDVIGTLAGQADAAGFETWMVTPDKDYHQLVTSSVKIYKPGRKGGEVELIGVPEVLERWQIERVDQVLDILGLMGDASDNIPGISGIGEKTAQKLIAKYNTIENLIEHASELKGKQRERVEQNSEMALLSKRLVRIQTDVPHEYDLSSFSIGDPVTDELKSLFMELEFDTLGKRYFGKTFSSATQRANVVREKREAEIQTSLFDEPAEEQTIDDVNVQYEIVKTAAQRKKLITQLLKQSEVCFDTETTGLDARTARPIGLAFSFEARRGHYVVVPEEPDKAQAVIAEFEPFWSADNITKIGHNLKYDLTLLKWQGHRVSGPTFDTMLAHSMKEPEMRHGLDYLASLYLNYKPISTESLIGPKGDDQKCMSEVPVEQVARYACEDADITLQLAQKIRPDIDARGVSRVCYDVEFPLTPVLVDMEFEGVRLNVSALHDYSAKLEDEIDDLQTQIYTLAGHEFKIDSPKQLGVVLYEELEVEENPKKTPTGQYSTREAELERLAGRHEIIPLVLEYRNARKLKSTYVDQLPSAVNEATDRVHTHYGQTWTATGRMQSNNPNLQTIPIRKERGREIRAAFVARDEDHWLLSADYSQIELRLMAELSDDPAMMQAFVDNEDIHTVTASKVYKVEPDEVTREMRSKAKTVNFGIIYGISAFGLQQRLNIPRGEASELINNYFEKYPGVRGYMDRMIETAKKDGYVTTMTGRRRYLRDIQSRNRGAVSTAERLAINSPIQGTAADMLKLAMIQVDRELKKRDFGTKMILTVHDEILFDMRRDEKDDVMPVIESAMKDTLSLRVPIEVEMGYGENWLEAH